jgi:hypothetical protein
MLPFLRILKCYGMCAFGVVTVRKLRVGNVELCWLKSTQSVGCNRHDDHQATPIHCTASANSGISMVSLISSSKSIAAKA